MMDIRKWLRKGKNATDENKEDDERHVVGGGGGGGDDHVDEIPTEAGQPGQASNVSPAAGAPAQAAGLPRSAAASGSGVTVKPLPGDLGSERPNQVVLQRYPGHLFQNKSRSFVSSWYQTNEWLEYSVQTDAAFCYPCRKFNTARGPVDSTFTVRGYRNWKHAVEKDRGFHKHATSKEHLTCVLRWKENERRIDCGKEISTLLNADQLNRNRYYVSALIDVVGFLAENQIPFRGSLDNFEDMSDGHSGLFLSLLNYTLKKDTELAEIIKHIPRNASYTSPEMQNELICTLSNVVTDAIVEEVGTSWFTIKVDGTRDPTECENISIIIRFVSASNEATERLLTIATADAGDAKTLTDLIIAELTKTGLDTSKILSQVYDGASVMAGKHGGVQKLLQEILEREIPYVHCLNHQLHLVVIHALAAEKAVTDFLEVCCCLYKFFRKPTVAAQYKGERLKRLLDQRWTGHLATVSVIIGSFKDITSLLSEIDAERAYGAEMRMEAIGLLREVSGPAFMFIAIFVQKLLMLLDGPNRLLQAEDMDLLTGLELVASATECVKKLRSEDEFTDLWNKANDAHTSTPAPPKRRRTMHKNLEQFVVLETTGQNNDNDKTELQRVFYSAIDTVLGEIAQRFSERNTQLARSLAALNPENGTFLDPHLLQHIMTLTKSTISETECVVAKQFIRTQTEKQPNERWTTQKLLSTYHKTLEAMPSVVTAMRLGLTFGASTAMCENSFSTLRNVFTDHRRSMRHARKAQLVQLAFERDLTRKCLNEWKEKVLRRFHTETRRLQLF